MAAARLARDQAENRPHAQKALLAWLTAPDPARAWPAGKISPVPPAPAIPATLAATPAVPPAPSASPAPAPPGGTQLTEDRP